MKRAFLIATVVAALGVAGPAIAAPFKGVVVAKQRGVMLVAAPSGAVRAIAGSFRVGTRVSATAGRVRAIGRANRAVVRGVVVRRSAGTTFLSAAGRVLAVHSARRLAWAPSPNTTLQGGAVVQTDVAIDDQGELEEQDEQVVGQTGAVQVLATVASIGNGTVTLTVNGQSLTIPLPSGLTLPASVVGTQVTLDVSFAGGQATAGPTVQGGDDAGDDSGDDNGNAGGGDSHGHDSHAGGGSGD